MKEGRKEERKNEKKETKEGRIPRREEQGSKVARKARNEAR